MIRFLYPSVLWLLALLPLLALLRGRRGPVAAVKYSSADIARQVARETRSRVGNWLTPLTLLALALVITALARPQFGRSTSNVEASGVDMILALDCSGSMEALDFKLDGQRASRLDVVQIGTVEDGTAIGAALATSVNRLRDQPGKSKIVVLLTDGQNNAGKILPDTAAQAAKALGVKVYTIGAGVRGEAPVPVTDAFGNKRLAMAQVDVDETMLQKVADETGGQFFRATDTESLEKIYGEIDRMEKTTHELKKFEHHSELFAWAILPALGLLGACLALDHTRFRRLP
jgi:Ca-activated chloride channel family protein